MSNQINIDHDCNQAIRRGIGERLRIYLRVTPGLPTRLRKQVDRLRAMEGQIAVPEAEHGAGAPRGCGGDEKAERGGLL